MGRRPRDVSELRRVAREEVAMKWIAMAGWNKVKAEDEARQRAGYERLRAKFGREP